MSKDLQTNGQDKVTQIPSINLPSPAEQYLARVNPRSYLDVLNSENKSVVLMNIEDSAKIKAILCLLIIDTLKFLNVGNSMNADQVMTTVEMILFDDYYSLQKIDYFKLCFTKAKQGLYGKQYGRIDGQIIYEWLAAFDVDYTNDIIEQRINEKKKIIKDIIPNENEMGVPMPDNVRELMNSIGKKPIEPVKQRELTEAEILVNGFIKDFDEIYGVNFSSGVRFIEVYGKHMDISEYLNYRMIEHESKNK